MSDISGITTTSGATPSPGSTRAGKRSVMRWGVGARAPAGRVTMSVLTLLTMALPRSQPLGKERAKSPES